MSRNWMSTREFSAKFGVSVWTARRWAREGRVTARHIPPGSRTRVFILDPGWTQIDTPSSLDPSEWACALRQVDVARLLGISARALRYKETANKAHYRLVGHRKRYSIQEVRRLIAERSLGHKPRSRQEGNMAMLRWAFGKLQQK
jgi:hypothetical protein